MLWLWCRLTAVAPIRPLAWEPPCAASAALKRPKKPQTKTNQKKKKKMVRTKRGYCGGCFAIEREIGLNSKHKDRWSFIAKQSRGHWMEND